MTIILHDLCGADDRRFSPFCWRARMALAHKGLDYEARPVRFTEIAGVSGGAWKTVPTIEHDGRTVTDSAAIADYLEDTWPDRPSLYGGPGGRALTRFVEAWAGAALHPGIIRLVLTDVHAHLPPADQAYFRASREARFGTTIEAFAAGREERLDGFRQSLQPLRLALQGRPFLGGDGPLYADYVAFGAFMWARTISPLALLAADDPLLAWIGRCLDLHGGLARRHPGYHWPAAA